MTNKGLFAIWSGLQTIKLSLSCSNLIAKTEDMTKFYCCILEKHKVEW